MTDKETSVAAILFFKMRPKIFDDKELFVVVDQSIGRDNVWLSSEETIVESSEKETEISGLNS